MMSEQDAANDNSRPRNAERALFLWFASKVGPSLREIALSAPEANGATNKDTLFVTLTFADAAPRRVVLRREPSEEPLLLGLDMSAHPRVLQGIGSSGKVIVPKILWNEPDPAVLGTPFFVMEMMDGRVPSDRPPYSIPGSGWVAEASPEARTQLWWSSVRTMAAIHRLDWRAAGLGWMEQSTPSGRQIEVELNYYQTLFDEGCEGHYAKLIGDGFACLRARLPDEPSVSLCWGDARLGNMIYRDNECVGVLDWEMASLGAAEKDLAWLLLLDNFYHEASGIERLPGWPSHAATLATYETLLGRPLVDMPRYTIFAALRGMILFARTIALGKRAPLPEDKYPGARLLREALDSVPA
jgi:aminoglycoside phosphotransferase (APT) family kinase protein